MTATMAATMAPKLGREYWLGCDLGRRVDRTAIVIVEGLVAYTYVKAKSDGRRVAARKDVLFEVAHILRMDAGTPFDEVVDTLCEFDRLYCPRYAWVDETGMGAGLMDMLRQAHLQRRLQRPMDGITLTAGTKLDILSGLDRVITEGRIRVPDLPGADKLRQELRDFHRGYTPKGNVTMGAVTEAAHDDLAIATALAVGPTVYRNRRPGDGCRIIKREEWVDE